MRTGIFFRHPDANLSDQWRSPGRFPWPGRRVSAIDVAAALAGTGARVLLVHADLASGRHRCPRQAARTHRGWRPHWWHEHRSKSHLARRRPRIYVLPAGVPPPNPADLLHSDAFAALLVDAAHRFDFVLVAAPALSRDRRRCRRRPLRRHDPDGRW